MVFPPPAPIDIPTGMFLEAHAYQHLEACQHNIGHGKQDKNPKEFPRKGTVGKASSIYWSKHSDDLKQR